MTPIWIGFGLAAAALSGALSVARTARADKPMPTPVDALGEHALSAVGGWNWLYYAGAVTSTAVMAPSGADHEVRLAVQRHLHAPAWGAAAYYGGYVLPLVALPGIYFTGIAARDASIAGAGSAATQALGLTVVTTIVLKIGTGRPFPMHGGDPRAPDRLKHPEYAREFAPFGFAGRYAWPSGHTSSAVSMAAALTASTGSIAVGLIAYPISAGIAVGMMVDDSHWASDVVAGALIGQAIGWSVGQNFGEPRSPSAGKAELRLRWVPLLGEIRGCAVFGEL